MESESCPRKKLNLYICCVYEYFLYYEGCSYFLKYYQEFFLHLVGIILWNKVNRQKCLYNRLLINSERSYQNV